MVTTVFKTCSECIHPNLKKDRLDLPTVLSGFFLDRREEDVFGGNAGICNAFVVAYHPYVNIWNAMLWLWWKNKRIYIYIFTVIWIHLFAHITKHFVHYLIGQESQLVEEVLCKFYFVFHVASLNLWPHGLCLLAHVFLSATDIETSHQKQSHILT